jgi:predicted component of type VI protein secretion system
MDFLDDENVKRIGKLDQKIIEKKKKNLASDLIDSNETVPLPDEEDVSIPPPDEETPR